MTRKIVIALIIIAAAGLLFHQIVNYRKNAIYRNPAFAHGNGRLEATEVNIAAKMAGRIEKIYVNDGDFVHKGQLLALMQTDVLEAELSQALARKNQALAALSAAEAAIELRKSELEAAEAGVQQRESACEGAKKRFKRCRRFPTEL